MNLTLEKIFEQCWQQLVEAGKQSHHAYRNLTASHMALQGGVNQYTVVLRHAEIQPYRIIFYTDVRSEKVANIKADARISALFYDKEQQCQLIVKGNAVIDAQNETALQHWKEAGYKGRTSYLAQQPPSTPVTEPTDGLAYLQGQKFDDEDMAGYKNFAVITIEADAFEYLKLNRETGNRRARFKLEGNDWQGSWIVP
ncbi:flavin-binding protein [Mucilaginibacter koreensis]